MESRQSDDLRLLDGSITTDRNGISFCFVAKALCRTCPCQDSHVSISEWSGTLPEVNASATTFDFLNNLPRLSHFALLFRRELMPAPMPLQRREDFVSTYL